MHRVTNHCDAQTEFFEWTSLQPFHGCDVATCFDVVGCRVRSEILWFVVRWRELRDVMSCHVMWCDLMCLHFMWCDFLCCVMSRNALRCHVMSSHVMSCHLLWSDAVQWDEILWVCDAMWLVAMSRCVVRSRCVGWLGRWSGGPQYTDLLRTTQYDKVLLQYYSCTTKYYSCTTLYYSSTTPYYTVLLQYYSVLHQYYKAILQHYSVLQTTTPALLRTTQYYSVLQSTTPVLLCTTKYCSGTTPCTTKSSFARRGAPTSPNAVPATQNGSHDWSSSHIWNVKRHLQCATSPNDAPATPNDPHEWCPSHMKRHLQCAEQQVSYTKITKCCACHEKWLASLILVTFEMSFTMRGATGLILQRHQILCLPRKMTRIIDPRDIWNVIYNARSNRCHPPTSPSTVPATKNDSHHWSSWHMKRHLQCAEQQDSSSNVSKYCTCHAKCLSWVMSVSNVIYNARSNRHHPPTSPNAAPATQNCTPKSKKNSPKTVEASFPMCGRFDHDPNMVRTWSEHDPTMNEPVRSQSLLFHFVLKITTFRAPAIYPDFTEYCACHEKWHPKITKYCACHAKWLSWLMSVAYETSFTTRGATSLILQRHQIYCTCHEEWRAWFTRDI